jgi:hypothetical protein
LGQLLVHAYSLDRVRGSSLENSNAARAILTWMAGAALIKDGK